MRTWTGNEAPVVDKGGSVHILDLVVHLGRERRWGGWGSQEWTVLHHSMLVALIWMKGGFPPEKLGHVLLHDAHEAYTGDIPSPIKKLMGSGVGAFEGQLDTLIYAALDLPLMDAETKRMVKLCDLAALVIEAPLFGPPRAAADVPPEYEAEVTALVRKAVPGSVSHAGALLETTW